MYVVDIDWPSSGNERYSYIGQTISGFTGNVQARLISVSELTRSMREDKELENNSVTVQLVDTDGYFSDKLNGADQYIKGVELKVYDDTLLLFTGYINQLPQGEIGKFIVTATLFDQLSKEINKKITVAEFPNVDDENAGQYSNYVFGHVCDQHVGNEIGEMIAYRVDTRKYLMSWNFSTLTSVYNYETESRYDYGGVYHCSHGELITREMDYLHWSEVESGGTVNRNITNYYIDIISTGAGTTYTYPTTDTALVANTPYYLTFLMYAGTDHNAEYSIMELTSPFKYLQEDGTWGTTEYWFAEAGLGLTVTESGWSGTGKNVTKTFTSDTSADYRIKFGKTVSDSFTWILETVELGTDPYTYIVFDTDVADNEPYVVFNGTGYVGPSNVTDAGYNINPITQLNALNTLVGSPLTFEGLTAAETEATTRAYVAMFAITDGMTWRQFLAQFARNFDLNIWQEKDGKIGLKMMDWGYETSSLTITPTHILDYKNRKDITQIASRIRRMYSWHIRKQYFAKLPIDVISTTAWTGDDVNLDLRWTEDDATALDVAERYRNIYQEPLTWITVSIDKEIGKNIELADVVTIIYPRGYYPNGEIICQVYKKTYGESYITIECLNIGVVEDGAFRLWDDSDPKVVLIHDEADADCEVLS